MPGQMPALYDSRDAQPLGCKIDLIAPKPRLETQRSTWAGQDDEEDDEDANDSRADVYDGGDGDDKSFQVQLFRCYASTEKVHAL